MSAKKALIIGEVFYPEDFLINELAKEWEAKGLEFDVLTRVPSYPFGQVYKGYKNKIYQRSRNNSITIHRLGILPGYNHSLIIKILNYIIFVFLGSFFALFKGWRYNKVFIYHTGPLSLAIPAILIKKIYRASIYIWTQDLWPDTVYAYGIKKSRLLAGLLNWLVRFVYTNCTVTMVTCEGFIPKIKQYTGEKEFLWIPNWPPDIKEFTTIVTLPGKFNFTFAGNIGKVQNLENVILGFQIFTHSNKDCVLNIVGDGSALSELKQLVISNNIQQVNFTGRKPLEEMPAYFQASDVLLLSLIDVPIYEITIPAKFQAYLQAEKPIFAIMNGAVSNMVNDYQLGYSANPSDPISISIGFAYFASLMDPVKSELSLNCKRLLDTNFSRNVLISKLTHVFWG